jgi:hypothetical protein
MEQEEGNFSWLRAFRVTLPTLSEVKEGVSNGKRIHSLCLEQRRMRKEGVRRLQPLGNGDYLRRENDLIPIRETSNWTELLSCLHSKLTFSPPKDNSFRLNVMSFNVIFCLSFCLELNVWTIWLSSFSSNILFMVFFNDVIYPLKKDDVFEIEECGLVKARVGNSCHQFFFTSPIFVLSRDGV